MRRPSRSSRCSGGRSSSAGGFASCMSTSATMSSRFRRSAPRRPGTTRPTSTAACCPTTSTARTSVSRPAASSYAGPGESPPDERDVLTGAGGLHEQLGRGALRLSRCVENSKIDLRSRPRPAFERSMAAWIAFRKAARTPAPRARGSRESSFSRRGHHFAELDRVHLLVAQELRGPEHRLDDELGRTSRESPSRIPASIIASARSAKYAGPEPRRQSPRPCTARGWTTRPTWVSTSSAIARWSLRMSAGAQSRDALVNRRRCVRHCAQHGHAVGQVALDLLRRDAAATESTVWSM